MTRQLALPLSAKWFYSQAGFVPGAANEAARAWLANPTAWPLRRLALYGPAGAGKTHLLHVFAEEHCGVLIPGEAVRTLVDLPDAGAIAVDDADAAPDPEPLLHLLNAAAEAKLPVLLAGRSPPAQWAVALPDLVSRLRATSSVALALPDDALLESLLARLIAERQLRVEATVQAYLLARLPRNGASLREAALRLDRASLAQGKRVGRAVAAQVLEEMSLGMDENVIHRTVHDATRLI